MELTVSFTLDADTKERVRAATDIVDLISSYTELRRQGRGFVALCPFHRDRRPSLQVNPDHQTWKCWVCDVGGDVFSFVMQKEGWTFPEALTNLAERAGITLQAATGNKSAGGLRPDEKQILYRCMSWASRLYHVHLMKSPEAEIARQYLTERGIDRQSIDRFEIGLVPDSWSFLIDQVTAAGFNQRHLEATGLIKRSERGHAYDLFRNRVMFPIRDTQKRVIAFGGRVLPGSDEAAKYINSPESKIFTKHQHLYGLDQARDAIRDGRQAIVMEGYTDVIVSHQCGLTNAVAVLGTALGPSHLKMLRHLCDQVILLLDGDEAGQRRSDQVLELFLNAQMDVRVLTLPDELDPADYLLKYGRDELLDLASRAPDALEFKMRRVCEGFNPIEETHRANAAMEQMLDLLAKVPRSQLIADDQFLLRRNQVLARLSRRFAVPEEELRSRLRNMMERVQRMQRSSAARESARESARDGSRTDPRSRDQKIKRVEPGVNLPPESSVEFQQTNERGETLIRRADSTGPRRNRSVVEEVAEAPKRIARPSDLAPIERELMELLVSAPSLAPVVLERVQPDWIESDMARAMFDAYQELELQGYSLEYASVLVAIEDASIKSLMVTLYEESLAKQKFVKDTPEQRLRVLTQRMGQRQEEQQRRRQLMQLEDGGLDDETELRLLTDFIRQARQSHGLDDNQITGESNSVSPDSAAPAKSTGADNE